MAESATLEATPTLEPKPKRDPWLSQKGRKDETTDPWDQIRAAVEAGVSILKASKRFGVPYERAKKRSQREGWVVPNTLLAIGREKAEAMGVAVPQMSLGGSERVKMTPEQRGNVGTLVAESAQEIAETASLAGLKLVAGLLRQAEASPHTLAPLVDVKDLSQAIRAARMAGSLDKAGPVVSLSLWSGHSGTSAGTSGTHTPMRDVGEWVDE